MEAFFLFSLGFCFACLGFAFLAIGATIVLKEIEGHRAERRWRDL